jgi:hypothetical protein
LKLGVNEFGHCCVTQELKKKGRSQGNVPVIYVGTVLVAINEQVRVHCIITAICFPHPWPSARSV